MRFSLLLSVSFLICCAVHQPTIAQIKDKPYPIKFGQFDLKEFDDKNFSTDSSAEAVIIADFGRVHFEYAQPNFKMISEHITRIKILKKSGYDWASIKIPLFNNGPNVDHITNIKGITYNLDNGVLKKDIMEPSAIFTEKNSANLSLKKFTLPNVKPGSVIEFTYTVSSGFFSNLENWQFQKKIPVRWSEYRVSIPDFFDYKTSLQGYVPLEINEYSLGNTQFRIRERFSDHYTVVTPATKVYRWAMKDIPAFQPEPFITTSRDYISQINFELRGVQFPESAYQDFTNSWSKINTSLLESENFGLAIRHTSFLKNEITDIVARNQDPLARAKAVHQLVKSTVQFNDQDELYTTGPLRKAYETHSGNAADINLLLIGLLREAGLKVTPVILSTRDNGRVNDFLPMIGRFNFVLAALELPGQTNQLLLDATQRYADFGILPERCLNVLGHLVTEKEIPEHWLTISSDQRYVHYQAAYLSIENQGGFKGKIHDEYNGYHGLNIRQELLKQGEKRYIEDKYMKENTSWNINSYKILNSQESSKPIAFDLEIAIPNEIEAINKIYISPLQYLSSAKNPFQQEQRLFPIDFGAPRDETYQVTIPLPSGYEIEDLPKNTVVTLAEEGGRFQYLITSANNSIQIVSRISFNRPAYSAEEYPDLREFYKHILAKYAERIVLKKKS